jgi:putative ABC transport system permease protein
MNFVETLRLALTSLAANKLRSGLTMLGIAVGVFSVIGVMTIIAGLRESIESGLNILGVNSFQFTKYPTINFSDPRLRLGNRRDLTFADAARFKDLMGESAEISLSIGRGGARASYLDRQTNPNIGLNGSDENMTAARGFEIASGRNISADDVEYGRPVILLGNDIVERLFPNEDPLNRAIRLDGQNYTVVGVLAPRGASFGQNQDNYAFTTITKYLSTYGRAGRSIAVNVHAPSQALLAEVQDNAVGVMRLVRGLAPEDANDFEVFSQDSLIEVFNNIAGMVAVGAFVISAIALVASGIGVMNIMLVSVTERTKEIGIRRSIGARKRNILMQFLIEAVLLSLVGGFAGIIFGIVGGNIGAKLLNATPVFPLGWAVAGLVVCSAIGVGFGFYPALKAASLDPIDALRYE